MKKIFNVFFIFFHLSVYAQGQFEINSLLKKEAFTFIDSKGLETTVYVLSNKSQVPVLYTTHILTEVCADSLCKPVNIHIYWDLLGNFDHYQTSPEDPLTKFDHVEFNRADHQKLQKILADKNSMLQDYEPEDLVDKNIKVVSEKVDGVTGATSKTFQDFIVPGAAYTVHRLWHIVNGELSVKILNYTQNKLNDSLIHHMLKTNNRAYKEFILNTLSPLALKKYTNELIRLIGDNDPVVPHFAMARLPDEIWNNPVYQEAILKYFGSASLEIQNTLLAKFVDKKLSVAGLNLLISAAPRLNKGQLQKLLIIFEKNKDIISENLEKEIIVLKKQLSDLRLLH